MKQGELYRGRAEKLLPGGEALVRVDGDSVLVSNAVPGDVLELKMLDKRRGVWRAEITELVEASDQRVNAPCPVAGRCGGCALQSISRMDQARLKSAWVTDAFASSMDAAVDFIPALVAEGHDRRRVRWFVGDDAGETFLGFYAPASHRLVRHDRCMVITAELNALRQQIERDMDLSGVNSVQAVQLDNGIHLVLETGSDMEKYPESIPVGSLDDLPVQWWWRNSDRITRPLKKPAQCFHDLLPAAEKDISLAVGPDDFVQGQREGNRELIRQIQLWAGSVTRIADLFCGIGNLSLPLAVATGAQIVGAELNPASVRAASANARELGIKSRFVVANLFESFDLEPYIGADVLLLDPPRRGAKRVCNQIGRLLPKIIIMVSCDVAAGARDGLLLQEQGYRLKALRVLDLFAFAGHVEAMSLWEHV